MGLRSQTAPLAAAANVQLDFTCACLWQLLLGLGTAFLGQATAEGIELSMLGCRRAQSIISELLTFVAFGGT